MNKKKLIVKDNALIHASYRLTLSEKRLVLLAIEEARACRSTGESVSADKPLKIAISRYAAAFDVGLPAALEALQSAASTLFERYFVYQKKGAKGVKTIKSRWISQITYAEQEGYVAFIFAPAVVPLITDLEKAFTSYDIKEVKKLSSPHSIRIYEFIMLWRSAKKTPIFELEEFKEKLGLSGEYERVGDLKKRVIEPAINQISASTDILASYEQHKTGRKVTGFSFTFSYKKDAQAAESERCSKTIDFVDEQNLTAKQLGYYAKLLAQSHWATQARVMQGVLAKDAVTVLMTYLKKPQNFEKHKDLIADLVKKDKAKR